MWCGNWLPGQKHLLLYIWALCPVTKCGCNRQWCAGLLRTCGKPLLKGYKLLGEVGDIFAFFCLHGRRKCNVFKVSGEIGGFRAVLWDTLLIYKVNLFPNFGTYQQITGIEGWEGQAHLLDSSGWNVVGASWDKGSKEGSAALLASLLLAFKSPTELQPSL